MDAINETPRTSPRDAPHRQQQRLKFQRISKQKLFSKPNDFGLNIVGDANPLILIKEKKPVPEKAEVPSDYIPKNIQIIESAKEKSLRKENSRQQYNKRKIGNRSFLNPKYQPSLTDDFRLHHFNNQHKCKCHKLRYNSIVLNPISEKYEISCDRSVNKETIGEQYGDEKCIRCRQGLVYEIDRDCECYITRCTFCKFQIYKFEAIDKEYCHCGFKNNIDEIRQYLKRFYLHKPRKTWKKIEATRDLSPIFSDDEFPTLTSVAVVKTKTELKKECKELAVDQIDNTLMQLHSAIWKKSEMITGCDDDDKVNTEVIDMFNRLLEFTRTRLTKNWDRITKRGVTIENLTVEMLNINCEEIKKLRPKVQRGIEQNYVQNLLDLVESEQHRQVDSLMFNLEGIVNDKFTKEELLTGILYEDEIPYEKLDLHGGSVSMVSGFTEDIVVAVKNAFINFKYALLTVCNKIESTYKNLIKRVTKITLNGITEAIYEKLLEIFIFFGDIIEKILNDISINTIGNYVVLLDLITGNFNKLKFMAILPWLCKTLKLDVSIKRTINNTISWFSKFLSELFLKDDDVTYKPKTKVVFDFKPPSFEQESEWDDIIEDKADLEYHEKVELHSLSKDSFYKFIKGFAKIFDFEVLNIKKFMICFRDFNTLVQTGRNISTVIMGIFKLLPKFIRSLIQTVDPREILRNELKDKKSIFVKWMKLSISIQVEKVKGNLVQAGILHKEFKDIKLQLLNYISENDIPITFEINRFIESMDKMARVPYRTNYDNEQPFIIRLVGDSGVGKSTLSHVMLSALECEEIETVREKTFFRNPGNDFWDGKLPKHEYVVYDDFNQNRDEEDLKEIILLASSGLFYANFSSLDQEQQETQGNKGDVVMFKAMVLCSNSTQIHANTLNSNEAINRRKNLIIKCQFNTLDKTPKEDWSHITFTLLDNLDMTKSVCAGTGMQGLRMMQTIIHNHYNTHKTKMTSLEKNLETLSFKKEMIKPIVKEESKHYPDHYFTQHADVMDPASIDYYTDLITNKVMERIIEGKSQVNIKILHEYDWIAGIMKLGNAFLNTLTELIPVALTFATLFGTLGGLIYGLSTITKQEQDVIIAEREKQRQHEIELARYNRFEKTSYHSGENQDRNNRMRMKVGHVKLHSDENVSFIKKNVCKIFLFNEATDTWNNVNGIFVKGATCLFNEHVLWDETGLSYVPKNTVMKVAFENEEPIQIRFDSTKITKLNDVEDVVLYDFFPTIQARSTIIKHFWNGEVNLTSRDVVTYQTKYKGKIKIETYFGNIIKDKINFEYDKLENGKMVTKQLHSLCSSTTPSSKGDCGSPMIIPFGLPGSETIVGINTGMSAVGSVCRMITKSQIEQAFKNKEVYERSELHADWHKPTSEEIEQSGLQDTRLNIYAISNRMIATPTKTKIIPSTLFNVISIPKTRPVILNMRSKLLKSNTFKDNILKYGKPSRKFDSGWEHACDSVMEDLNKISTITLNRPLTLHEAINGIEGYPYLTALEMTTSPAFPFVLMGQNGEKRKLFDGEPGNYTPKPELQRQINEIIERCQNNIYPDYPFIDTIKDERKPIEDVMNGKSRLFSMSAVALTIVQRMFCLPTIAQIYQTRPSTFISIGINKASEEWDDMIHYLMEVGTTFFDMDYKKFDTTAQIDVRLRLNEFFIKPWMTDIEKKITRILLAYDAQPLHQWEKYIIAIPSGTSSGSFITAAIGSMINESYIRTAWKNIMPRSLTDIYYYRKNVRTKNYGDDIAMVVSDTVKNIFNPESIKSFLEPYLITITPGSKGDEFEIKNLYTFTFLKNTTGKLTGKYVPLQQDCLETINWIRTGATAEPAEIATENNCNSVLRALFFYGAQKFHEVRNAILQHKNYNLISYDDLLIEWTGMGQITDPDGTFTFSKSSQTIQSIIKNLDEDDLKNPYAKLQQQDHLIDETKMSTTEFYNFLTLHAGEDDTGTMDQPAQIIDAKEGAILANQKQPALIARAEGRSKAQNARSKAYNGDAEWSLDKMLDRWALAGTKAWNAADTPGTQILTVDVLAELLKADISTAPYQRFNLARHDSIKISLQTIGYRFCRGRALAFFLPSQRPKASLNLGGLSIQDAVYYEAKSLDPTAATVAELIIPYTYIKQYLDLVNGDVLGQLIIMVQNQLVPGTMGPSAVDIKYLYSLQNPVFKQPRAGSTTLYKITDSQIQAHTGIYEPFEKITLHMNTIKGAIDEFIDDVNPTNIVKDFVGNFLDHPQLGEQIIPLVNKEIQYFNHSKNVSYVDVLTLHPDSQQMSDADVFSSSVQEMKISELLKKKCNFIKTVEWTKLNQVGDVLWSQNVGPMADVPMPLPNGKFTMSLLSYISSMHSFWRGSFIYFFEVVSTQMHEGKLDFCFHPQASKSATDGYSYDSRVSQYFQTCHIRNGGNVFALRAIYPGDSPTKKVWTGIPLSDAPGAANRFQDYFSGSVSLVVSSILNAPETVQTDVEVNIYYMAAEDYELFMQTGTGTIFSPVSTPVSLKIDLHSGKDDRDVNSVDRNTNWFEMKKTVLGATDFYANDVRNTQYGEQFDSLSDLCKRYYTVAQGTTSVEPSSLSADQLAGREPITLGFQSNPTLIDTDSPLRRIIRLYRNFRGALVYKLKLEIEFVPTTGSPYPINHTTYLSAFNDNSTPNVGYGLDLGSLIPKTYVSNTQIAEFKVPFLSTRTSVLIEQEMDSTPSLYTEDDFYTMAIVGSTYLLQQLTEGRIFFKYTFMQAFADETMCGVFYSMPRIQAVTGTAGTATPPDYWPIAPAIVKTKQQQQQDKQPKKIPLGLVVLSSNRKQ